MQQRYLKIKRFKRLFASMPIFAVSIMIPSQRATQTKNCIPNDTTTSNRLKRKYLKIKYLHIFMPIYVPLTKNGLKRLCINYLQAKNAIYRISIKTSIKRFKFYGRIHVRKKAGLKIKRFNRHFWGPAKRLALCRIMAHSRIKKNTVLFSLRPYRIRN